MNVAFETAALAACCVYARVLRYTCARRNLKALVTTETELKLMAAAAIIGLSSRPKTG